MFMFSLLRDDEAADQEADGDADGAVERDAAMQKRHDRIRASVTQQV
ncbi:hypothetical protein [Paraburkholderia humisilvae]|nr:hypothetical protein [Paraburkholderia humisilvae]